jgi:hypothetical protein
MSIKLSLDELWQELCQLAVFAPQQLRFTPAFEQIARFSAVRDRYLTDIRASTKIWLDLEIERAGWLILLDRDPSSAITCLSPSPYVPEYRLERGIERLPQRTSIDRVFQPEMLGDEVLVAIILPEEPSFSWLTGAECLELEQWHLQELLTYIKNSRESIELIRSQVRVFDDLQSPSFLDIPRDDFADLATMATKSAAANLHQQGISTYGIDRDVIHETKPDGSIVEIGEIVSE